MQFLRRFWDGLVNLILPASEEAGTRAMSRGLRWILHALLLGLVLLLLWWLNSPRVLNMPEKLPGYPPWVKGYWLPILFLLFYVLCWLGWWLWKEALRPDDEAEPVWFGGCYLAGTGAKEHDRAFVPGVFQLLLSPRKDERLTDKVRWTAAALAEEQTVLARVGVAWIVLVVLGLATAGLLLSLLLGPGASSSARPRR